MSENEVSRFGGYTVIEGRLRGLLHLEIEGQAREPPPGLTDDPGGQEEGGSMNQLFSKGTGLQ